MDLESWANLAGWLAIQWIKAMSWPALMIWFACESVVEKVREKC